MNSLYAGVECTTIQGQYLARSAGIETGGLDSADNQPMTDEENLDVPSGRSAGRLETEENRLWRLALMFVVLLATALAAVSWERLQSLPYHLGSLLPGAVLCVAIAFSAFSYG